MKPAAHLTCVNATKEEVDEIIRDYWDLGVRHIVALRGDPPGGVGERYEPTPGGYVNAADLTRGIKAIAPFEVSVGCYPEKHPELPSLEADLDMLKAKIDAGATTAITQFFFDNEVFFRFLDRARARRHRRADRAGPHSDPQFQADLGLCREVRRQHAGLARPSLRGLGAAIRRRSISSPPLSPPSRCSAWSIRASTSSISTR